MRRIRVQVCDNFMLPLTPYIILTYIFVSFHNKYTSSSSKDVATFRFYCSQSEVLLKNSRKNADIGKQRDKMSMTRFNCNGILKVKFYGENVNRAVLKFKHNLLHARPEHYGVTPEIKDKIRQQLHLTPKEIYATLNYPDLTQKQVHYWWTQQIQDVYKKNDNQLISAKILLEEAHLNVLVYSHESESDVKCIGFLTNFFDTLKNNHEIICDATCK